MDDSFGTTDPLEEMLGQFFPAFRKGGDFGELPSANRRGRQDTGMFGESYFDTGQSRPRWNPLTYYETPTAPISQSWGGNPMLRQGRSRDTMENFFGPQTVAGGQGARGGGSIRSGRVGGGSLRGVR